MKVTFYTKKDCGLCDEAERVIADARRVSGFDLETIDIEGDEAAFHRYWARVPVVAVDGKEVAEAPIDKAGLKTVLSVPR